MIINALPEEYFKKDKIPNSVNLSYKSLEKLTTKSKERRVMKFLRDKIKNYPKLNELVTSKKLDIKDIPIITYCAHSKCNASEKLIDHLYECKINNVYEWKEGIDGWNKLNSSVFFPDAKEKEEDEDEDEKDEDEKDEDEKEEDKGKDEKEEEEEEEEEK